MIVIVVVSLFPLPDRRDYDDCLLVDGCCDLTARFRSLFRKYKTFNCQLQLNSLTAVKVRFLGCQVSF